MLNIQWAVKTFFVLWPFHKALLIITLQKSLSIDAGVCHEGAFL